MFDRSTRSSQPLTARLQDSISVVPAAGASMTLVPGSILGGPMGASMSMSRTAAPAKKALKQTQQMTGTLSVVPAAILPEATVTPYTFFYPGSIVEDTQSKHILPNSIAAADQRGKQREKKQNFLADHAFAFDAFRTSNLSTVHKAFVQHISGDGTLTKRTYAASLVSLGVGTDDPIIDRTFQLFDVRHDGIADYKEIISALDVIINGTNKNITCHDCFSLFDPTGCGYIIRNSLAELKRDRREDGGANHLMVKVLTEIIDRLKEEDSDNWKKNWLKRNKGRKRTPKQNVPLFKRLGLDSTGSNSHSNSGGAKGAKGAAPAKKPTKTDLGFQAQSKIHMTYDEFCVEMAKDPMLVQAFLGRILLTMESVYLRNKRTAADRGIAAAPPQSSLLPSLPYAATASAAVSVPGMVPSPTPYSTTTTTQNTARGLTSTLVGQIQNSPANAQSQQGSLPGATFGPFLAGHGASEGGKSARLSVIVEG